MRRRGTTARRRSGGWARRRVVARPRRGGADAAVRAGGGGGPGAGVGGQRPAVRQAPGALPARAAAAAGAPRGAGPGGPGAGAAPRAERGHARCCPALERMLLWRRACARSMPSRSRWPVAIDWSPRMGRTRSLTGTCARSMGLGVSPRARCGPVRMWAARQARRRTARRSAACLSVMTTLGRTPRRAIVWSKKARALSRSRCSRRRTTTTVSSPRRVTTCALVQRPPDELAEVLLRLLELPRHGRLPHWRRCCLDCLDKASRFWRDSWRPRSGRAGAPEGASTEPERLQGAETRWGGAGLT